MNFKFIVAFFLVIGAVSAVPAKHLSERTTICSQKCLNHETNLFKEVGQTHHFTYETQSEIELENGQKTQVQLKAKVDVSTISPCEHQLHLRKVQISGPQEAELMKQQLEQHSTKFSQDNGRIESVCFDEQEATWVANLKRAVLSTIQVSVREETEQIVEKDVLGYCNTQYEQISANTLKKTKFLNTCTKRSQSVNSILTGDFDKQKKSTCKIQLDSEKQLKSVVCEESNSMLPFAHSKAAGQITTQTKLTLDRTEKSMPEVSRRQLIRDSLVFSRQQQNGRYQGQDLSEVRKSAEQIIDQIRSDVQHNIQKDTPEKIKQLQQHLAVLNVQELERLAQQVAKQNDKVQDIFFDTVAQTGTQETAHIVLKVVLDRQFYRGEVSKVRKAFWLSMLSNVEQVDEQILDIALEHIRRDNLPRQALFALTGMINEIKDDQQIKQDSRYQKVVSALIEKLNRASEEQEKIAILKALRNTGVHHESFEQILNIAKQSRNVETRIAAVQALEQHVTEERFFKKLMKIFENTSNESELRIAAFQVLVNNQEKVHELYNVLKSESNKQVGSYVVSYFKNARESQIPEFETLRRITATFDLPEKRFERNDLRQSRHIQFTQQSKKFNLNAQVEADLIFDEQKQLRNVRAKFDLNKEKLQLKSVEVHVRQTGLPEVAQQMVQELTRQANLEKIVEEVQEITSIRSKQELNQKINKLVRLLNLDQINLNSRRFTEQVDASIHVRVQDKTVLYLNIRELASLLEQRYDARDAREQIVDSLTGDNAITLILTNKQHRMPTAHGLPVHSGHSLVVVAALKNQNGAFLPSIASDFHYEMGFTLMKNRSKPAIHYHLQMHTAPGLKVNVERKNGLPSKVTVAIPENRLEVITVRSIVRLQKANGQEEELNVSKNQRNGCTRVFSKILGAELCQQTVYPRTIVEKNAANALFNGPFEFTLYLQKTDSSIKHWEARFETPLHQSAGQAKALHFAFNTVGSKVNREVSAKVELQNDKDSKIVHIDLRSPVKKAKIEARAQWTQEHIGVKAALIMDNQRFEAELGGERAIENGEQQYRPSIKLTIPGLRKIHYQGKVSLVNSGKKENFQIELRDAITNQPLIKASAIKSGKIDANENFKLATDLQAHWITGSSIRFVSNIDKSSTGVSSDLEVIHSIARQAPTKYVWKFGLKDLSNGEVKKYNADWELNVPHTEFQNVAVSMNFVKKIDQEIESELTAFWSNRQGQKSRQVHILQQLKRNKVSAKISSLWENLLKVEIVPLEINYEVQAKTNWQRSQEKYNVQLTARDVKTNKQYRGEMTYQMPQENKFKMNLEAKLNIENKMFKIVHNIEEQEKQQYHGRAQIELGKEQQVELNYVYKMKENSLQVPRLNHELDASIRIPSIDATLKHKSVLKLNANQFELRHSLRKNNAVVSDVKIALNKNAPSQLLVDSQLFQVKVEGDVSRSTKQITVLLNGKQHDLTHQTKLTWSGKQQLQIESRTTKSQRQLADVAIVYQKNQKAEAKIAVEKLGQLIARHQPNGQEWATVEISSDRFSRPIKQQFTVEKIAHNKYTIRSKTQKDQQIVGEFDLELGSSPSLRVAAFDWKVTGSSANQKQFNLVLENSKKSIREEMEVQYSRQSAKVQFKHLDDRKRTTTFVGQVSTVDESKMQFDNEHATVEIAVKPVGQQKHARLSVNDKKHNIQHKSELRYQDRTLIANVDQTERNQKVISHESKLSMNEDSHLKTETKQFTLEARYKRQSAIEVKFAHQNGWKHSTTVEIINARKQVAKLSSSTLRHGEEMLNVNVDLDGLRKIDIQVARKQDKAINLKLNLKDQQKYADLQAKYEHVEINSKWSKQSSQKDQKLTFEIVDKKQDAKYNLLAQHQRKTLLHIKVEGKNQQKSNLVELKLHRQGEAFFKIDAKDLKLKTELDFARSPVQATVTAESRKYQIKHEMTVTFLQQENELKIKSKTDKDSKQIANVDFRINPTTRQIFASGEVQNKQLKIEGNVNGRYSVELKSERDQFKHETELDMNTRNLRSETTKNGKQLYKINARISNRRDVDASATMREHEITVRLDENSRQLELNYNNKKMGIRSTGQYTVSRDLISAKINGQQKSKQIIDLDVSLRAEQGAAQFNSFESKLAILESRSSLKVDLSDDRKQVRANVEYVNREKDHEVRFTVDTLSRSEQQVAAKIHFKNLKIEKELRLVNGKELKAEGRIERNGQQLVKANMRIEKPFKINGQVQLNTRSLKGQATLETVNRDEVKIEFSARDSQERKIADVRSKISKSYNKINVAIDFDSERTQSYTLNSEWRKESDQLAMSSSIKSKGQKVGQLEGKIQFDGLTLDAKLEGDLTVNGKRKEIVYKLNNLSQKLEHVLKLKTEKYSYGYDITLHLKQGHFIIHLPNRIVELRYDVQTQVNGHYVVIVDVLPNVEHQPNNVYNFRFDNTVQMANQEFILNVKTSVHHPEIHHPIEVVFRGELRAPHHQRPVVVFVSYDASSNQQSRISALFEITNESNLRVAHFNISHQNTPIFDVHYRWAVHVSMVHQQLSWSVLNRNTQRTTGELLAQVDLKQRKAKLELNNKHKLQVNWETNFDKNTIVHLKAQTDSLVRKMKIVANNKSNQLEITNYENEKIVSNYIVSVLKEKSSLLAVEMHQKQGAKLEKVAFIQLVKDSLNYAKLHVKVEQRLVYQIQNSKDHLESKIRSFARRHAEEIREVAKQQYQNLRLDEQSENTARFIRRASEDLRQVAQDYQAVLRKYLPDVYETVSEVYQQTVEHMRRVWNVRLDEKINQIVRIVAEKLQKAERKLHQIKEAVEERRERIAEQYRELKEKLNHDVVVKLSNQLEEVVERAVRSSEREGEQVYSFLHRNLKHVKLHKLVEQIRSIIVKIKNQVKHAKVHETLHSYIFEQQSSFEGKWNPRGGEILVKTWFPTRLTSQRF